MTIYVNHGDGDGERIVTNLETTRGVATSLAVNHGDGNGEQTIWRKGSDGQFSAYDAQELTVYEDGDKVSVWQDAWCERDLVQETSDVQPTYRADGIGGEPAIEFTGSEYFDPVAFESKLPQPYTYYVVLDFDGGSGRSYPFYGLDAADDRGFVDLNDNGNYEMWAGSGGAFGFSRTSDPVVLTCVYDGADSVFRIDDVERTGDPGSMAQRGHQISSERNPMRGRIGEVRTYNEAHDEETRATIVYDLAAKWNLPRAYGESSEPAETDATIAIDYDDYYDSSLDHNGLEIPHRLSGSGSGTIELTQGFSHSGSTSQTHVYGSHSRTSNVQLWFDEHANTTQPTELYSEFYVYFPENFEMTSNGTHRFYWPGYRSGRCASGTTCVPSGDDGWSIVTSIAGPDRGTSANNPPDNYEIRVGLYHMDAMSDPNPTGGTIGVGQWHKLGYYWRLNTYSGGRADRNAVVDTYIDDEHVHRIDDVAFVNQDGEGSTHIGFTGYQNYENMSGWQWWVDDYRVWIEGDIPDAIRVTR